MAWTFPVIGTTEWSGGSWMPNSQTHRGRTHAAIDIYASRGQTIVSPVAGQVKNFGHSSIGGNWIQIEGRDGNVYYFAHMDKPVTLKKGQQIGGGAAIGLVGNTGSAVRTKPHVHFSVKKNGKAVSPVQMLRDGVVVPDVAAPELTFTGEAGGSSPAPWNDEGYWSNVAQTGSESLPAGAQEQPPAWFDQLTQYRNELAMNPPGGEDPQKIKARRVMHGTLTGMANMVRSAGFQTGVSSDTGIDDGDVNVIEREGGR